MFSVPLRIVTNASNSTLVASVSMEDLSSSSNSDAPPLLTHNAHNIAANLPFSFVDAFHASRSQSDAAAQLYRTKNGGRYRSHVSTLLDEIDSKYSTEQGMFVVDDDESRSPCIYAKPVSSPRATTTQNMQMCSPTKQGHSHLPGKRTCEGDLEVMILTHACIGHLGNVDRLANLVHNVTELDLTGNLVGDWKQVTTLLTLAPQLTSLNMSRNPLHRSPPVDWATSTGRVSHARLRLLVLNATNIKWDTLYALLGMLPNLQELFLSMNDYSKRRRLPSKELLKNMAFNHIGTLYVNNCGLDSWRSLTRVCAAFPRLDSLVAADNPLTHFGVHDDRAFARTFAHTTQLNVNRTAIDSWEGLASIRHFKALHTLRLYQVPVLQMLYNDETHRWMMTISRLPEITSLNGTRVTREARIDAERAYLRVHYNELVKETRYAELVAVHGELEPLVVVDLTPKITAQVRFICRDLGLDETMTVPLNKSVMHLRHELVAPKLGVTSDRVRLLHKSTENAADDRWDEIRLNSIAVHSIGIQDGDAIEAIIAPMRKAVPPYLKRSTVPTVTRRTPVVYRTNKLVQQRIKRSSGSSSKSQD